MQLGRIERATGKVLESVPVPDAQNPNIPPPADSFVWHYVRFDFFQTLLKNAAIRFTRLDKQSDKTDGQYSDANARQMTQPTKELFEKMGKVEGLTFENLQQTNEILRRKAYVHCWSTRTKESAWMWNTFLPGQARSVAIRSTVGRVRFALSGQRVLFYRIVYYPRGVPRPEWSYTAPFTAKDHADFHDEREFRLMFATDIEVNDDDAEFKLIPVNASILIAKVVVHPVSSLVFRDEVKEELRKYGIGVKVARSELQVADLEAEACAASNAGRASRSEAGK